MLHHSRFAYAAALGATLAALLALGSSPARATMIRCQDAAGRITYQDSTCPNGARGVPIDPYQSSGTRFATPHEINRAMKPEPPPSPSRERIARSKRVTGDAAERRFIAPGATTAQVRQRIGDPDYTERAPGTGPAKRRASGGQQQWVYLPAQGDLQTTTLLTVKDGVVTRVERRVTY